MHKCLLHCTIGHDNHEVLSNSWRPCFQIKHWFCCFFESHKKLSLFYPVHLICILSYLPVRHLFLTSVGSFFEKVTSGCFCVFLSSKFISFFFLVKCRLIMLFCSAIDWRRHLERQVCSQSKCCLSPIMTLYFSSKYKKTHLSRFYKSGKEVWRKTWRKNKKKEL